MGVSHIFPQMHVLFIWTLCFAENWRGTSLSVLTVGLGVPPPAVPTIGRPMIQPCAVGWWGLRCQEECSALLRAALSPPHLSLARAFVCTPWEENNPLASDHTWIQPPIWHLEKWANSLILLPGLKPGWKQLILTALIRWWVSKGRPHLLEKIREKGKRREERSGQKEGKKGRKKRVYSEKERNHQAFDCCNQGGGQEQSLSLQVQDRRGCLTQVWSLSTGGAPGARGGCHRANTCLHFLPCFWL